MTKTVQDNAPKILEAIQVAKNILLHCHPSPDPDSVCSALAMKAALEQLGKKAMVIRGDSKIPESFSHFPGFSEIVDKSFAEINLADYDLFISQDSGGVDRISTEVALVFPSTMTVINIDHHTTNPGFGSINLVDDTYPATAAMLFDLFKCWGITLNERIATDLFVGIYTDSGGFKYPGTTSDTFAAAAELVKFAPNFGDILFAMENSNSKDQIIFQGIAFNSLETYFDEHLVIAPVSYEMLMEKKLNVDQIKINSISTILKSVVGWDIAVSMVEKVPGEIKTSMRSRDPKKYDVSKITASLGGGGHKAAAGVLILGTLAEAKQKVIDAVEASL